MASEKDRASEREANLAKYREYYDGVNATIYDGFASRFINSTVSTSDKVAIQNIAVENHLRVAIQRRMGLVPLRGIQYAVIQNGEENDTLTDDLNDWVDADNFGPGISLEEWLPDILKCLEVDGEVPIKLILKDGTPKATVIDDSNFDIVTNPRNVFEVTEYVAKYYVTQEGEDSTADTEIIEQITDKAYTVTQAGQPISEDGAKTEFDWGFIPLVLIKREDIYGDKHGRSGLADLIEPQDNITRTMANILMANKYGGFPMIAVEEGGVSAAEITIGPNVVIQGKADRITSDGASDALYKDKEQSIDALYRLAGLQKATQDDLSSLPDVSGKALLVLNAEGKRQIQGLIARLKRGLARMCEYAMIMQGKWAVDSGYTVNVTFPSIDQDDPQSRLSLAQFLTDEGYTKEALRTLGYDDDDLIRLESEKEEDPDFMVDRDMGAPNVTNIANVQKAEGDK